MEESTNRLTTRIVLRNDSSTQWLANNTQVLLSGEVGIEFLDNGKVKMKIGDGTSTWAQLPYFDGDECRVTEVEVAKGADHVTAITSSVAGTTVNKGDIAIVKEAVIEADKVTTGVTQKYQYTSYIYGETASGSAWKAMDGNYSAENVYFNEDFTFTTNIGTVTGVTSSKKVEAAGKSVKQFFSGLFAQEVAGGADTSATSKGQPYASVTLKNNGSNITSNTSYEVGTTVVPSYSASFEDGKYTYGPEPTGVTVSSWDVTSTSGGSWTTNTGSDTSFEVTDNTSYSITARATHSEGSAALSNIGNAGSYKFSSGTKNATTYTISGYRAQFYGAKVESEKIALTSDGIRTLNKCKPGNTFNGKYAGNNKNGFQITIPEGCKQVVVALYGKTLKNVYDHAAFGTDVVGSFVEVSATTPISVKGASANSTSVNYNVYVFAPDTALGSNTYDVVIG